MFAISRNSRLLSSGRVLSACLRRAVLACPGALQVGRGGVKVFEVGVPSTLEFDRAAA